MTVIWHGASIDTLGDEELVDCAVSITAFVHKHMEELHKGGLLLTYRADIDEVRQEMVDRWFPAFRA